MSVRWRPVHRSRHTCGRARGVPAADIATKSCAKSRHRKCRVLDVTEGWMDSPEAAGIESLEGPESREPDSWLATSYRVGPSSCLGGGPELTRRFTH